MYTRSSRVQWIKSARWQHYHDGMSEWKTSGTDKMNTNRIESTKKLHWNEVAADKMAGFSRLVMRRNGIWIFAAAKRNYICACISRPDQPNVGTQLNQILCSLFFFSCLKRTNLPIPASNLCVHNSVTTIQCRIPLVLSPLICARVCRTSKTYFFMHSLLAKNLIRSCISGATVMAFYHTNISYCIWMCVVLYIYAFRPRHIFDVCAEWMEL